MSKSRALQQWPNLDVSGGVNDELSSASATREIGLISPTADKTSFPPHSRNAIWERAFLSGLGIFKLLIKEMAARKREREGHGMALEAAIICCSITFVLPSLLQKVAPPPFLHLHDSVAVEVGHAFLFLALLLYGSFT